MTPENFRIRRRKDGIFEAVWTDSETGNPVRRSTKTRDPEEAKSKAQQIRVDASRPSMSAAPTIAQLIDAYLDHLRPLKSPQNFRGVELSLIPIKARLGNLRWDQLGQNEVDWYARERATDKRQGPAAKHTGGTISASTIDKDLRMLRAALNDALARRYIPSEVKFRINVTPRAGRDTWLTREEVERMIAACQFEQQTEEVNGRTVVTARERDRSHIEAFLRIALATGARKEAILSLKWDQVHINHSAGKPALNLKTGEVARGSYIDFGDGTGNKKRPKVPISRNPGLMSLLLWSRDRGGVEWAEGEAGEGKEVHEGSEYVITYKGRPVRNINKGLQTIADEAGVKKSVTHHVLKHTAITWFLMGGMQIETVAKLVNTSAKTLLKTYAHLVPEYEDELGDIASI